MNEKVYVSVCMRVFERERKRGKEKNEERERENTRLHVSPLFVTIYDRLYSCNPCFTRM